MTPTWQGNSVGHYEGDTLVVDTVGIKTGPLAVIDRSANRFEFGYGSELDLDTKKKALQVEVTVDDPGIFTMPWSGLVTYRRGVGEWLEVICAENLREASGPEKIVPVADKPDF